MITILNNIMTSNGYIVVDAQAAGAELDYYLFKAQSGRREEYFLTLELEEATDARLRRFIDEEAQAIFEDIQKSNNVEGFFEKNCTMIICLKSNDVNSGLILEIEEDPYNFKKNVVTYSDGELLALSGYLTANSVQLLSSDVVNDILNAKDGNDFLDFKNQKKSRNLLYDLIIRLVLKLPFLVYSPREQKLENLSGLIDKAIPEDKVVVYNWVLELDWTEDNTLENVESIWGVSK